MSLLDKPGEPSSASIPLYVVNGVATVWDAQTAATIHCEHDVSGLRAGTLPGVVQQNGFLGLPVTFMPEETTHLVNKGVAHLVPLPSTITPLSPSVVAARTAQRVARARATANRMRTEEDAKQQAGRAKFAQATEAATAKREERARKKAAARRAAAIAAGEDPGEEEVAVAAPPVEQAAPKAVDRPTPTAENSNIFTVIPALPVHPDLHPLQTSAPTALSSDRFPFPHNVRDAAVAQTFSALHANGLRMGLGPRFGGEWLVYPGDYLRYHAHFTSQVIVRDDPIKPTELVAWGRLGTGTKKAGLLCCWDDGKRGDDAEVAGEGAVEFYSLEWANFG